MFGFEIGQRESDFYSERTESLSHPEPYYNINIINRESYLAHANIFFQIKQNSGSTRLNVELYLYNDK